MRDFRRPVMSKEGYVDVYEQHGIKIEHAGDMDI